MLTTDFLFAGKAVFTVQNNQQQHYTFKVVTKTKNNNTRSFVNIRTGENFVYVGMVVDNNTRVIPTRASAYKTNSKPIQVFNFALRIILGVQPLPKGYTIYHEGKCGACGKPLTNPESIATGLGPICRGKTQ